MLRNVRYNMSFLWAREKISNNTLKHSILNRAIARKKAHPFQGRLKNPCSFDHLILLKSLKSKALSIQRLLIQTDYRPRVLKSSSSKSSKREVKCSSSVSFEAKDSHGR